MVTTEDPNRMRSGSLDFDPPKRKVFGVGFGKLFDEEFKQRFAGNKKPLQPVGDEASCSAKPLNLPTPKPKPPPVAPKPQKGIYAKALLPTAANAASADIKVAPVVSLEPKSLTMPNLALPKATTSSGILTMQTKNEATPEPGTTSLPAPILSHPTRDRPRLKRGNPSESGKGSSNIFTADQSIAQQNSYFGDSQTKSLPLDLISQNFELKRNACYVDSLTLATPISPLTPLRDEDSSMSLLTTIPAQEFTSPTPRKVSQIKKSDADKLDNSALFQKCECLEKELQDLRSRCQQNNTKIQTEIANMRNQMALVLDQLRILSAELNEIKKLPEANHTVGSHHIIESEQLETDV